MFIKGFPENLVVKDTMWGVARIHGSGLKVLDNLAAQDCHFDSFRNGAPSGSVMVFISRIEATKRDDAIDKTIERLDSLLDCYSTITEAPIKKSNVLLFREGESADLQLLQIHRGGYVRLWESERSGEDQWNARNHLLLEQLLQYLDLRSGEGTGDTELTRDLFYAMRMYRLGGEASSHGLEFLAKFSAMECLVCGSEVTNRGKLLKDRLWQLLSEEDFYSESLGEKLWSLRCIGSHQSRVAEHSDDDPNMPAGVAVIHLERVFACVLYFFLENLRNASDSDQLWNKAGKFSLPELITKHLPDGVTQMAVTRLIMNPKKLVTKIGPWFDAFFP